MKNKSIKNLEINKDFVSSFFKALGTTIVIGALAFDGVAIFSGIRAEINSKKNSKSVDTKDNKQYEEKNSDIVYSAPEGYHLEGTNAVKNVFVLDPDCMIYDAHTKIAPKGYHKELVFDDFGYIVPDYYHLEMMNGIPYAVYDGYSENSVKDYIDENGVHYVAPDGYTLEISNGQIVAVRKYTTLHVTNLITTTNEDGMEIHSAPAGYTIFGDKAICEIVRLEYIEPIILQEKQKIK